MNRVTPSGRRDYALLLTMSAYGMGAAEVLGLRLSDIDWNAGTLRLQRPKTGVETLLPLSPVVGRAIVAYLRHGRPRHVGSRALFLRIRAPHGALSSSSAIRHLLIKYAKTAGGSAPFLGSHVLRHSHAGQQIEQGALPKVVADILGHRRPESTSVYVRIATARLRRMALPVPR